MSVTRLAAVFALGFCLLLAACHDPRRETVRSWLQTHPPAGFEVLTVPERIAVSDTPNGGGEAMVTVRYRLINSTVQVRDAFDLPRGREIATRLAAVRGWAIASLPAGNPTREAIATESARARAAIPVKRVVTEKGAEVDSLVLLALHREPAGWKVIPEPFAVNVPGARDEDPKIPLEDSPEVAAKFDDLEKIVSGIEETRGRYLAERQRTADSSLARLRARLQAGNAFEGHLAEGSAVRLIVARDAARAGAPAVVVLTIQRGEPSTARYTGGIVQQPSGEFVWRAAQVLSLSNPGVDAATDARRRPILTLAADGKGLVARVEAAPDSPVSFRLAPVGKVDLLPEEVMQKTGNQ